MEGWFDYHFKDEEDFKNHFIDFHRIMAFIVGGIIFIFVV